MVSKKSEIRTKKRDKSPSKYFLIIGFFLIVFALIIPISIFTPVFKAEINYQLNKDDELVQSIEPVPTDSDFSIIIPKINANTRIIKDVDPFNPSIYQPALTRGVAHAKGTSTPDKSGNTFIFAHSAGNWYQANQFNAVFYLLNKLETGDEVFVYYQDQKYSYLIEDKKLIKGDELNYMSSVPGKNQLTLMTCWPPGTTLNRLIVIATLKND